MKTQIFEKQFCFSSEKNFGIFSSPVILHNKRQKKQTIRHQKVFWQLLTLIGSFFKDVRGRWKRKFLKKRLIFQWLNILATFFSYPRVWQTAENSL